MSGFTIKRIVVKVNMTEGREDVIVSVSNGEDDERRLSIIMKVFGMIVRRRRG